MNLLTRIVLIFFLIITPAYSAPIANNDTASTSENTAIEIDVLSNDTGDAALANTVNIKRPYRKGIFARRNGDVHFTPKLNAVGQESFQYTVRDATGAVSSPGTVTVTVNGAPSDITLTNATVSENEALGTLVGALTSSDPNLPANPGDSHTYALVAGIGDTNNNLFQIIGDQLQTTALLNFESQANLNIRVRSTDAGNLFTEKNFTISVIDVNEVPNVAGASFTIAENSSIGTSVGNVTVSDPDAGQSHSFSITGGNTNGAFTIDTNNGSISVANNTALNFETTPIFTLTVQATDNGSPNLSNTATITIHLTDVNEAPDITAATFSIAENSNTGTSIGTVSAVDVDTGQSLTYAITAGNIGNAFAINQSTGEIVVNTRAALNFETTPSFSLTVEASDNGSPNLNSSAVITVNLSNVNEAPSANNDDAAVDEAGTVTVLTSSATQVSFNDNDPDVGDLLFVTTTPVIAPTHGVLTLNADGSFSYTHDGSETTSDSFVYEVCDSAPLCSNATVNIAINPVNDAPVASIPGTQTSDEDVVLVFDNFNSNLLSIADADAGINQLSLTLAVSSGTLTLNSTTGLTFSVGDGNADATMTLTGLLSDINNALDGMSFQPDLNSSGNSTLTLSVDDQGNTGSGGALTDSGSVTLTINAVNDAPENNAPVTQTINEDTTLVFNGANSNLISISDIDASSQSLLMTLSATNGNLTLSTISGLAFSSGDGTSDSTMSFTGSLSDINASLDGLSFQPDANAIGNATLSITTNDQGNIGSGGALSDTDTVSISINSINDAPTFAKGLDPVIILEDSGAQSVTGWASTIDDGDPETTQTLTFNITGNSNPSLFSVAPSIDASTGTLTYTPTANANGSATITVELSDNGGTANGGIDTSSSQTFVINVTAVNDVPSFTKGADQTVNEDPSPQTVSNWATAISTGPDNEASQTVTFQVGNNNNSLFSVQPAIDANGTLTYSPAANANGSATVTVSLQDSGGTSDGGIDTSATQTFFHYRQCC
ncbi:cadherin domain-containing protein [Methylocucumis oryzae]|uniref:Cadherin domain-containing protein n=1 Tax=Methylocucumis oryzae TaxID=1632867 RepID=A0A0F3IHK4_9GAMM|nr:Ig-like domain-containing protein [Methylocucumis oryzae]KJV06157.1 hypothetical protein VZ94_13225 [Methylocucumis oryzae]